MRSKLDLVTMLLMALAAFTGLPGCGSSSSAVIPIQTGALAFDSSSNAYVAMGTSSIFELTGTMTVEAWVKADPSQTGPFGRIVDKFNFVDKQGFNLVLNSGVATFAIFDTNGTEWQVFGTTNIRDGQWRHIAGTWDGQNLRIYVDGMLENTNNVGAVTVSVSSNPLSVGSGDDGNSFLPLNGCIDEVRIWNVERSEGDLAAFMGQCLTGAEAGLIGYWRFDEGTGTVTADQTSGGNDGTFVNGPTWTAAPAAGPSCP